MTRFFFALLMIFSVHIYAGYTSTRSSYSPSRSSFSSSRPTSSYKSSYSPSKPSISSSRPTSSSSSYTPVRSSYTPRPTPRPSSSSYPTVSTGYTPRPTYTSSNGTTVKTTPRPIVTPSVVTTRPQVTSVRPSVPVVTRPTVVERTTIHNNYIRSEPFGGSMSSFMAGALVTHMIMDNGHRREVYSNGNGGAYYVNNGMQVPLVAQPDGQFTEQTASVVAPSSEVRTETSSNPPTRVREKDDSWGFSEWFMLFLVGMFIALAVAFVIHIRKDKETVE